MKSLLNLVVIAVMVVGCGGVDPYQAGEGQAAEVGGVEHVQETACRPDTCGEGGVEDPPPLPTVTLDLYLQNQSAFQRQCSLILEPNTTATTIVTSLLDPGVVTGVYNARTDWTPVLVNAKAVCKDPQYPEISTSYTVMIYVTKRDVCRFDFWQTTSSYFTISCWTK